MSSRFEEIDELLDHFDDYQNQVDSKKSVVKYFLETLQWKLDKRKNFITKNSKFYKIGSSYEDTVVSANADFDIAMVLPHPFIMDFFETVETDFPGFYKLKCTDDSEYFDDFINGKDYLKVEELRDRIFVEIISVIETMVIDGYKINFHEMGSSVCVTLKSSKTSNSMKMDIVPQIGASALEGHIPGWYQDNIPSVMESFLYSHPVNILFNLSCPPDLQDENFSHLVVQPAFNLIEKECMQKSNIVREAVRISKAVCKYYNWMEDGLRSFHIKRIALSLFDEIEYSNDPWDGYKIIMKDLISMLEDGRIDGCFIENQVIICKDKDECRQLGVKIKAVVKKIQPNNILKRLGFE